MTSPFAEVIGDPVDQSKSPIIHRFWLEKLGLEGDYRATRVTREGLGAFIEDRRRVASWRGCNVTMPLKLDALALADTSDDMALGTGAANILLPRNGNLIAGNTDVGGILAALPPDLMPAGSEVCVLGTGGAARAALTAMRIRSVSIALISARDLRAGWRLLEQFGFGGTVRPLDDSHNIQTADVIINATPLGMNGHGSVTEEVLGLLDDPLPDAVVLDLVTAPVETELIKTARAKGLRTVTGLTVLIEQAAESFRLFFDEDAPRQLDGELMARLSA